MTARQVPAREAARRWWAVGAIALAILAVGLDLTVLSLALPTLAIDLHASTSQLQWVTAAYSLVLAAALLPGGMLGDRFGRKKVLLGSLVLFGAASAGCTYAGSAGALIAMRAVLGLGAAAIIPLGLAVLPVLFTEDERQRAVTVLMGTTVAAYPIGPILGGWLLTHFWWGSVFLINIPIAVIAIVAVAAFLPESRGSAPPRLDWAGVALSSGGLAALTYGLIKAGQNGWGDALALGWIAGGLMVLAGFAYWEMRLGRTQTPLVDLDLFRSPAFTWGTVLQTVVTFAMFGLMFTIPQYFQAILGVDAMGSGLRLLPVVGGLIAGAAAGDRLVHFAGARVSVTLGFAVVAAGLFSGAFTSAHTAYGTTAVWITLMGAGLGLTLPTAGNIALGALSPERSGVGTGLMMAVRTAIGGTLGVAILGSVLNGAYHSRLNLAGLPASAASAVRESVFGGIQIARELGSQALAVSVRSAFVHGMDVLLWTCGGIAVTGGILAVVFLRAAGKGKTTRDATAETPAAGGREQAEPGDKRAA